LWSKARKISTTPTTRQAKPANCPSEIHRNVRFMAALDGPDEPGGWITKER